MLIAVAMAAPFTPIPSGKMNSQSSTTLIAPETTLHHIANLGAPSSRSTKSPTVVHSWKSIEGKIQTMYPITCGINRSDAPSRRASGWAKPRIRTVSTTVSRVTKRKACVMFMRAAFSFPRAR